MFNNNDLNFADRGEESVNDSFGDSISSGLDSGEEFLSEEILSTLNHNDSEEVQRIIRGENFKQLMELVNEEIMREGNTNQDSSFKKRPFGNLISMLESPQKKTKNQDKISPNKNEFFEKIIFTNQENSHKNSKNQSDNLSGSSENDKNVQDHKQSTGHFILFSPNNTKKLEEKNIKLVIVDDTEDLEDNKKTSNQNISNYISKN